MDDKKYQMFDILTSPCPLLEQGGGGTERRGWFTKDFLGILFVEFQKELLDLPRRLGKLRG